MENRRRKWRFEKQRLDSVSSVPLRAVLNLVMQNINEEDPRPIIPMANGDPSQFPCFRTTPFAEEAIIDAVHSAKYYSYAPVAGVESARRAIADYLNLDLPYKLSSEDVYLTAGGVHAIDVSLAVLSRPGANILLPRPGFPYYESRAAYNGLEVRHFDLLPEKGWEVDLDAVQALADENTAAMVIINPGNPCGNVYSKEHLQKVADTARKLGILVIADEVYGHLTFGVTPFVPMGVFGSVVPVLTLGSISKRWMVPGWRLGWLVTTDPNRILQSTGVVESIKSYLEICANTATFIQGAVPQIVENTTESFFLKTVDMLREAANICCDRLNEIPCLYCPKKPEGTMFVMVKLNLSHLEDISDDMDFCVKLAKEESVIIVPGSAVGMKNWLRITFACELPDLKEGLRRIETFCQRHYKNP